MGMSRNSNGRPDATTHRIVYVVAPGRPAVVVFGSRTHASLAVDS